jgi:hypothetical protein
MARLPRVEYAGAIYHVTVRMAGHRWEAGRGLNASVCLFRDDRERERFLEQLGERVEAYRVRLYILALCGRKEAEQRDDYTRFVEAGVLQGDEATARLLRSSPFAVGGEAFVNWIREQLIEQGLKSKHPDDTGLRKVVPRVPVDRVLNVTADVLGVAPAMLRERHRNSDLRGVAAHLLCRHACLTQREAAAELGMRSGSAVALQLQRLAGRLAADRSLRRQLAVIEKELPN